VKGLLANLLLLAGTVLGGLAAANSVRAWKWLSLEGLEEAPGQYLFEDPLADGAAPASAEAAQLTREVVQRLHAAGHARVKVKDPPRESEAFAVAPTDPDVLVGRVLAEELSLSPEWKALEAGSLLDARQRLELEKAGVTEFDLVLSRGADEDGDGLPDGELGFRTRGQVIYQLPRSRPAGTYIDSFLAAEIAGSGSETIEVRVVRGFSLGEWSWKYHFMGSLLLLGLGVLLKRSMTPTEAGAEMGNISFGGPRECIERLEARVRELVGRAEEFGAETLHRELTPLLRDYCYPVVEAREVLRARVGAVRFAHFMGPFASGERKLNRAWSAAVDGHAPEARASLRAALPFLEEARAAYPD